MTHDSIITIGGFDGVHVGHQALLRRASELADEWQLRGRDRPRILAVVLDPNPTALLRPDAAPPTLTTLPQRTRLLREHGADEVVRVRVTPALLSQSPEEFLRTHIEPLRPVGIVEGPDFRFGKDRAGDLDTVAAFFGRGDFLAATQEQVEATLTDLSIVPARSSMIRWLLTHGRVRDAAIVLSRPHELHGSVTRGDQRGRGIGFPTANLDTACMLPGDGVYGAIATLPSGRRLGAAVSVGVKPTFQGSERTAEAFLLNEHQRGSPWSPLDGLPEYGWTLRLHLIARVRDQQKFSGLTALAAQIERDCARIADLVRSELRTAEPLEVRS